MNYYAYDCNADLHHLGEQPSPCSAHESALNLLGTMGLKKTIILSEEQIMASAVTARLMGSTGMVPKRIRPPRVTNMITRGGNVAPNHYIINDGLGNIYFQSYGSIVARADRSGNITLDTYSWDYSKTTGQYRNQFLNEGIVDTRAKITSGRYTLANLN
jgi:hypothetical protein